MSSIAQHLLKWDSLVLVSMAGRLRQNQIIRAMQWISKSADGHAYPIVLVPYAGLQSDRWAILGACIFAFCIELAVYKLIKQAVKRPRPFRKLEGFVNLIEPQDTFSFPSGHTAGAFVAALIIGACNPIYYIAACLWASLVGISRIYLGVHYPTDVAAGACLGALSAKTGLLIAHELISSSIV